MRQKPLVWQIFPSYLIVLGAALLAATGYTTRAIQQFYQAQMISDLEVRARVLCDRIREQLRQKGPAAVHALCREMGSKIATRVTVIQPDGVVIGDSEEYPADMDNHAARPEVAAAMKDELGASVRFSQTLRRDMIYVAVPLRDNGTTIGVVRVSLPVTRIRDALWVLYARIAAGGLLVVLLAALVSWHVSRRLSRSLEEMKRGVDRFAQGDFSRQLSLPESREMASLAEAMNRMAQHLDDRIRAVINQRNQQEAVLSSMVEGVLAVDNANRIISVNDACARLMGVRAEEAQGRLLHEVVRNAALKDFVAQAMDSPEPIENEFVLHEQDQQMLQAHGTVLRDAHGRGIGAVVVLNDVTRLRRLEQVRRDFVANVSHELRTPITSIKGFVETLLDGALENPDDARRFLEIVAKQSDRLNAILGDLLTLSRIEEGERKTGIPLEMRPVRESLAAAVQLCASKAATKCVIIELDCAESLMACINASMLEQAVANLVDNAIKYSDPGGAIRVYATMENGEVVIHVQDHGCGIPSEHLPRLFERFYRVDKARSRSLGGTGLGLSIVKHIAKVHRGRVWVESTPGKGSTFFISVPSA